jgi:hypothetical protein
MRIFGLLVVRCGGTGSVGFVEGYTTYAQHTGYVPLLINNVWGNPLRNYSEYVPAEHLTQAVSKVQKSSAVFLRTEEIKGFGVCRV